VAATGPAGEAPRSGRGPGRACWGELAYGLGLVAVGFALGVLTLDIKVPKVHAKVGPTIFPWVVAGGLVLIGAALAWRAWRAERGPLQPRDLTALAILAGGLLQQILLVAWAGFVPTAAVLFAAVATAFGRRRPLVDLAIGLALALIAYLVFTRLLGLGLPAGWLAGVL
jgi:putative tricarboxylic transport membrane protein